MMPPNKYTSLDFIEAPGHPAMKYTESEGEIIIKYFKFNINVTWSQIERIAALKKRTCGKTQKPNNAEVKREIKRVVGEPATRQKTTGIGLFVRLVSEGKIKREDMNAS